MFVKTRNPKSEFRNKLQISKMKISNVQDPRVWNFLFFPVLICFAFRISNFAFSATTRPSDQLATWFSDLANKDASVREQARVGLMGISRADLQTLRKLVEGNRPLAPSQAMALREIVMQVYEATEPYEAVEDKPGFLGVPLRDASIVLDSTDDDTQAGVLVTDRIPGFCAYRFLQNGDVIVGITEAPGKAIRKSTDLTEIIKLCKAGDTIHLEILRGGQKMTVAIKLDARPNWAPMQIPIPVGPMGPNIVINQQDAIRERQRKADDYWDQTFAPLLESGIL
jgi:hypothetical protein